MNAAYEKAKNIREVLVKTRRDLHRHPEASMKEFATTAYLRQELDRLGIPWLEAGPTGTVGVLGKGGPVVGLRGDIDALEMDELNECEYQSENPGAMHACGHDAHAAGLLGAARILKEHEDNLHGTVKLIFQPGEENGLGAASVVDSGAVSDVNAFFALHVSSSLPTGTATLSSGVITSANDKFRIWIKGRGCHGSTPEKGSDALLAGSALVQNLQALISRESSPLEPTVITIGIFHAGTGFNILPEDAYLEGSVRVLDEGRRLKNREAIRRMAEHTAAVFQAGARVEFECTAKIVNNDEELTALALSGAEQILGAGAVAPQGRNLGAEDFGGYLGIAPGTYINIGSRNEAKGITAPHHHGQFDVDEDALPICAAMYAQFALDYLKSKL